MDGALPTAISEQLAERAESLDLLTLGVEEEYLLVDGVEPRAVESVDDVFEELPDDIKGSVQYEYMRSQIEAATPPVLGLRHLWASMTKLRTGLAEAADRAGARIVAVGAGPAASPNTRIVDTPRYRGMRERFGDQIGRAHV